MRLLGGGKWQISLGNGGPKGGNKEASLQITPHSWVLSVRLINRCRHPPGTMGDGAMGKIEQGPFSPEVHQRKKCDQACDKGTVVISPGEGVLNEAWRGGGF